MGEKDGGKRGGGGSRKVRESPQQFPPPPDGWEDEFHLYAPLKSLAEALPEVIGQQSDRASVLVIAAMVDRALERLIREKFMRSPDCTESDCDFLLTKRPVPPGSASVRATVAIVLGIIGRGECRAIQFLCDIRNKCAHEEIAPPITPQLGQTLRDMLPQNIQKYVDICMTASENYHRESNLPDRASSLFLASAMALWMDIWSSISAMRFVAKFNESPSPPPVPDQTPE